jgi:hypothetical protein
MRRSRSSSNPDLMNFPFTLVAGHVLFRMDGKRVLLDACLPFSFRRGSRSASWARSRI